MFQEDFGTSPSPSPTGRGETELDVSPNHRDRVKLGSVIERDSNTRHDSQVTTGQRLRQMPSLAKSNTE